MDLVLIPVGFLRAKLGDMIGRLADEAVLAGPHARNSKRVFS